MSSKQKDKGTVARTITINKNVAAKIEKEALKENRNFSNMIETLALEELKKREQQTPNPQ